MTEPNTPSPPNIPAPKILRPDNNPEEDPTSQQEPKDESLWTNGMKFLVVLVSILVLVGVVGLVIQRMNQEDALEQPEQEGQTVQTNEPGIVSTTPLESQSTTTSEEAEDSTDTAAAKTEVLSEVTNVSSLYNISLDIPANWELEAATEDSVNIFDPAAPGSTNLERSQVFIRSFEASEFLTLSTVTVHEQTERIVAGRPAITYDIEKLPTVADFAGQPSWRNDRHEVTDIRQQDSSPSTFFVIARNPSVDASVFEQLLSSFETITDSTTVSNLTTQTRLLESRVYHKPFGILINPATSPIQPERFSGYHNGIDLEFDDIQEDVPVVAIADGTVVQSSVVNGYGGLVVIQHPQLGGRDVVGIYGHLDPATMTSTGAVQQGEQIGVLGKGFTTQTDGERKHLHFGLYIGNGVDIRGYVPTESMLSSWVDPAAELERLAVDGLAVFPIDVTDYPRYTP